MTRKKFWHDEEGPTISLDEWLSYAATDPGLRQDDENPREKNWTMLLPEGTWPLWWSRGELITKNPEPPAIAKLVQIASSLGAQVLADDDEAYT